MNKPPNPSSVVWHFVKREPLVHFLGAAILLFVANAVFTGDDREIITVDVAAQEYLIKQRQDLLLRPMTEKEKIQAIEDYLDEEILVREARKRGFENNSRIRSLLIQNMRFFMTSDIPDPPDEDLRKFFTENAERFATKPSITYEHVLFSNPDTVPPNTIERLRSGDNYRSMGDTNTFNAKLPRAGEREIVATFGRQQAPEILVIKDDLLHGPFTSPSGIHFLRVSKRHPGKSPSYDSARNWLHQEWLMTQRNKIIDQKMSDMRKNYHIEVQKQESESQ